MERLPVEPVVLFFLKQTYPTPVAAQLHFQRMDHLSIYGTDGKEQVPAHSTTLQASSIKLQHLEDPDQQLSVFVKHHKKISPKQNHFKMLDLSVQSIIALLGPK